MTENLMPPINHSINNDDEAQDQVYQSEMDPLRAFQELKHNKNLLNVNRNMYLMAQRVSF